MLWGRVEEIHAHALALIRGTRKAPRPATFRAVGELDIDVITQGPVVVFRWRNAPGWPVEYASPNASEVFGWSAEEFMGGDVAYADLIAEESLERVGREVAEATQSGVDSFVHEPYEIVHRDGTSRWLYDATKIVRDDAGAATHYVGYVIDVTERVTAQRERRDLERQLLHTQKLESLGVLAGGVAHDFNNLLTGILGHANLALKSLAETHPAHAHVVAVERLTAQAAELTRQLLAYSGRGRFEIQPCDLGDIVHDMRSMLDVVVSKKARVVFQREERLPAIMADRTQLQQIVMNLITNASDALEGRTGTIRLNVSARTLDEDAVAGFAEWELAPGEYVVLDVSDDGIGMSDETRRQLFDPFFSTKVDGRGLGLSAVLGVVRGHRGALQIESELEVGTTFRVFFPTTDELVPASRRLPPRDEWHGRGVVLIVDDQAHIRTVASNMLEHLGFETLCASNGERALELFEARRQDIVLVLLDLTMPIMDGNETLEALLALEPTLPIVMSSGYDQSTEVSPKIAAFLEKPYRIHDVRAAVRAALGG